MRGRLEPLSTIAPGCDKMFRSPNCSWGGLSALVLAQNTFPRGTVRTNRICLQQKLSLLGTACRTLSQRRRRESRFPRRTERTVARCGSRSNSHRQRRQTLTNRRLCENQPVSQILFRETFVNLHVIEQTQFEGRLKFDSYTDRRRSDNEC